MLRRWHAEAMKVFHWCILSLVLACGGSAEAGDVVTDEVGDAEVDAGHAERALPLCAGSLEQTPELCQELRHSPLVGYCNFWHECPPR